MAPPPKAGDDSPSKGGKRKAKAEAKGAPKPKKMTKEEKAAAKERARVVMSQDSSAPPPASGAKKKKATPAAKKAATVTIKEDPSPKGDSAAAMEMPLPPTSLQRTQSTPLELELEHQVKANLEADMKGDDPVFKEAPPAHLLKFAPTELEEGYDHDETNAANIEDDPDAKLAAASSSQPKAKCPVHFGALTPSIILEMLVVGISFYLFWFKGDGSTTVKRWTHGVMSRIPILPAGMNPYRTSSGKPLPYDICYSTNIDDPPLPMREECSGIPLTRCPSYGKCYGGYLQDCKGPYLELTNGGTVKSCAMVDSVATVYNHVVDQVSAWTLDFHCDIREKKAGSASNPVIKKMFANYPDSPRSYMTTKMHDTKPPTQQPLFELENILDMDPFLLMNLPDGGSKAGQNPIQSLYGVLEETNKIPSNGHFKLQTITKYGAAPSDEEQPVPYQIYLIGRMPSKQNWWRSRLSTSSQCSLLRMKISIEYGLKMPWLIGVWVLCMIVLVLWVFISRYYWIKAQQQQSILAAIEIVRNFVLQTLEADPSKIWKGPELLEYTLRNGPPLSSQDDEMIFRKRIWPRVVFDVRGDIRIHQTVQMSSGCELIHLWNWIGEPTPTQDESAQEGATAAAAATTTSS